MALGNDHIPRRSAAQHGIPPRAPTETLPGEQSDDRVVAVGYRPERQQEPRLLAEDLELLRAVAAHVIPADGRSAGIDADGAVSHIQCLLAAEPRSPEMPLPLWQVYRSGCNLVRQHALQRYGHSVEMMSAAERDELIWDMLEGSMDGFDQFSPAYFFHMLRRHIADAMLAGVA